MWKHLDEVLWLLEALRGHQCGILQRIPGHTELYVCVAVAKICNNVQRHY